MENESVSYFVSKVFDFFKPLPPTPPDRLDLAVCYGGLVALACISIYCGSIGSLPLHPPHRDRDDKVKCEDSDGEDEVLEERITTGDAWMFPILGSCMLFGLYLLLKYLGPEWVNEILRYWFAIMSWVAVFKVKSPLDIEYVHSTDYLNRQVIPLQDSSWAKINGKPLHATPSMLPAGLKIRRRHHPLQPLLSPLPPLYSI